MKTTLSKLDLELLHPGTRQRISGMAVLLVGALLTLATVWHFIQVEQSLALMEGRADYAATRGKSAPQGSPTEIEETRFVRESIDHLALPWNLLFTALETVSADNITLVSVVPNVQKSSVQIVAETADLNDMLQYVRELSKQRTLKDVMLSRYEILSDNVDQSVRFTLTASWGERR
jgi:hypothetical protein